jgi:hypothetical protein
MDAGLDIGQRAVGRAIRRLVNYSLIQMDFNGAYQLTADGRRAHQQVLEADGSVTPSTTHVPDTAKSPRVTRRLTVVMPPSIVSEQPTALYIGVNPPNANEPRLSSMAHVALRLSGIGGDLSASDITVEIPANDAAAPVKVLLTARPKIGKVRVRIDSFQIVDLDRIEAAGAMYFDLPVVAHQTPEGATRKAVGIDLTLG